MQGGTVAEVVESNDDSLAPGDFVLSHLGWQAYGVQPAKHVRKLDPERAPISTAVGVLGMPGFTAYAGLLQIGKPQPGETVVVAAAAGPVGSAVGQIARIKGARAVGIAGGAEKVAWLTELGFDVALDHRSPTFKDDLKAAVPGRHRRLLRERRRPRLGRRAAAPQHVRPGAGLRTRSRATTRPSCPPAPTARRT